MNENDSLAEQFEANRTHLRMVAYRMLGSVSEADDAVQEAWLRLNRSEPSGIDNLGGWLTTVVARVSLDMLRSRKSRREELLGPHVPEPIVSPAAGVDPEHEALLADSGVGAEQAFEFRHLAKFARPVLVNGAPGFVSAPDNKPFSVMGLTIAGGRIVEIDILADPERLEELDLAVLGD